MQKITDLKSSVRNIYTFEASLKDIAELWEMALEADDEQWGEEAKTALHSLNREVDAATLDTLLGGEYDDHNAIITLHSGAGGVESCDWAEMLLRMYTRYCERKRYKTEVLDILPGDEAGVKSVTFSVDGPRAYGYLKSEKGVHRLVRISPFDAAKRRHTSFASVSVMPQVANDNEVEINDDDLRIDTYRSGGKGGQHLNKTDSAVRITHLPTGIVVQCQDERSQHSNKDKAMKILSAKLLEKKIEDQAQALLQIQGDQQEIGWGNQIRSYVFQPYRMVKDHRTGAEAGNVDAVMDGALDEFISAYLHKLAAAGSSSE